MKTLIPCIILLVLATSSTFAAPRLGAVQIHHHNHQIVRPHVSFEELFQTAVKAYNGVQAALKRAADKLLAAVGGTGTDAGQKLKVIMDRAEGQAAQIIEATIAKLQHIISIDQAAHILDDAVKELEALGLSTAAEVTTLGQTLSAEIQAEFAEILKTLEAESAAAIAPLQNLLDQVLGLQLKSESTKVTEQEIVAAAIAAALDIERALQKAVTGIQEALAQEEASISANVQAIIDAAKAKAEEEAVAALTALQNVETEAEALAIAQKFVDSLKQLGYDTKAAIEEAIGQASAEGQEAVKNILNNLVEEIRVALQPLQDLLDEAGAGGKLIYS